MTQPAGDGWTSAGLRALRTAHGRTMVIDVEIEMLRPRMELAIPADKDALPLLRQALRALGKSVGADLEKMSDAELALTEAATNAVRHAYRKGEGVIEVAIEIRDRELLASVKDRGRGMSGRRAAERSQREGGLGLTVIESVTRDVEIRTEPGIGTEVVMALSLPDGMSLLDSPGSGGSVAERAIRRLVAMAGAQADLPPERITEVLLATELIARHVPQRLVGASVDLRVDRLAHGIEFSIGPLEDGGGGAILRDIDLPGLGPVIERLSDGVRTMRDPSDEIGEHLVVLFCSRDSSE